MYNNLFIIFVFTKINLLHLYFLKKSRSIKKFLGSEFFLLIVLLHVKFIFNMQTLITTFKTVVKKKFDQRKTVNKKN